MGTFLYNLPIFFERTWTKDENGVTIMENTELRTDKSRIYTVVYETWMYICFNLIIPLLCLTTFNFLILKKVKPVNFGSIWLFQLHIYLSIHHVSIVCPKTSCNSYTDIIKQGWSHLMGRKGPGPTNS